MFLRSFLLALLTSPFALSAADFAKGADISWVSEMVANGRTFRDDDGQAKDLIDILQNHGMDTVRLRVWHSPANGYHYVDDVVAKAVRAKELGMRVMIDFHYSDTWADPAHQTPPAAWADYPFDWLMSSVWWHTRDVMVALRDAGVTPEWVQIGNETNDGLLWPHGKASTNMRNYAWLINSGHDAVKEISPTTQVIVHVSNGWDNSLFRWNIGGLVAEGAKFDIIGLSLYPEAGQAATRNAQCLANMQDLITRYGKPVMIVECGYRQDQPADGKAFLADLIAKVRSLPDGMGRGVLYWEPQAYDWYRYGLGAWEADGTPSVALDAFLEGQTPTARAPETLTATWAPDQVTLRYPTEIGQRYQLEHSTDGVAWQPVGDLMAGDGAEEELTNDASASGQFFRVRAQLP